MSWDNVAGPRGWPTVADYIWYVDIGVAPNVLPAAYQDFLDAMTDEQRSKYNALVRECMDARRKEFQDIDSSSEAGQLCGG